MVVYNALCAIHDALVRGNECIWIGYICLWVGMELGSGFAEMEIQRRDEVNRARVRKYQKMLHDARYR